MKKTAIIFFTAILVSGCASTREVTKREVLSLTIQHFKETVIIKQVSSGEVTKFSTLRGYRPEKYLGIPWMDSFLIGYLNNQSGKRYYQVYQFVSYQGRGWRLYSRVNYETPEGTKSMPLKRYHKELKNCSSSRNCTYEEHVVFDIEEALLRKIAKLAPETQGKTNANGKIAAFLYQLSSREGHKKKYWLLPAEVAGLMEAMDDYTKSLK
jgi:hypothetical protein